MNVPVGRHVYLRASLQGNPQSPFQVKAKHSKHISKRISYTDSYLIKCSALVCTKVCFLINRQ